MFKAAREHKIPFTSVKVIFDDLKNPIPNFLINSINTMGIKYFEFIFPYTSKTISNKKSFRD